MLYMYIHDIVVFGVVRRGNRQIEVHGIVGCAKNRPLLHLASKKVTFKARNHP